MAVNGKIVHQGEKEPEKKGAKKKAKSESKMIRIQLVRSLIGRPRYQREVVKGLGLRKVNSVVFRKDSPEIWGMVKKIPHLLKVEAMEKNEPE